MMTNERLQPRTTSERIVETLDRHELPDPVATLVDRYERTAGDRDRFLWKWLHYLYPGITLSCTGADYHGRVRRAKLLSTMYVVLLDDLAEMHRDRQSFLEAAKIPFDRRSADADQDDVDGAYVTFADEVWSAFERVVAGAPRRDEFVDVLRFDVKQNLNAVDYSYLANEHLELGNLDESTMYDCHNMMLLTYADIDLMHAGSFDRDDLASLRRILLKAQEMARIGNWLTTWERELVEGDYSSAVPMRALQEGAVDADDLTRLRDRPTEAERVISAIRDHGIEDEFVARWHADYADIDALADEVGSVDVDAYLDGIETLFEFQLASRGLK